MGKFKDRLDSLEGGDKFKNSNPNNLQNNAEKCEPGRTVNFKTGEPVTTPPPPGGGPGAPPTIDTGEICDCFSTKIDELIDDVRNTYPYGTSFNTGKLFTQTATPIEIDAAITSQSLDPSIIGFYDAIPVATKRNNLNARQIWIIADPDGAVNPNDPFLYVKYTNGPSAEYSVEVPVRVGEDWEFRDVYEFRIRASVEGQQYRITTDPHHTTFVSTIVNVPPNVTTANVVLISGQVVEISGQQVFIASESGQIVTTDVSGNIVQVVNASGQCLCANVSGDVVIISGQSVLISGQSVLISGQPVNVSGSIVSANVSGNIIQVINASGQTITLVSGQYVAIDDVEPTTQFRELASALTLNSGENDLTTAVIDNINEFAYFGTTNGTAADAIIKVDTTSFTRVSSIVLVSGEGALIASAIDPINNFAFFGTSSTPDGTRDRILRINLKTFSRQGFIILNSGESGLSSAVVDQQNGFLYLGTNNGTPRDSVIKIRLSDFTRQSSIILNSGENTLVSAVIDSGFAYFGTANGSPNDSIVQINLSNFTRAGAITTVSGAAFLGSAIIDTVNGFAYFGTNNLTPFDKIVKIDVPALIFAGVVTQNSGLTNLKSAVYSPITRFAYWGTGTNPAQILKVTTSGAAFVTQTVLTILSGENQAQSAIIDTINGFAYFGTNTSPGKVVKLAIDFNEFSIPGVSVSGNIVQTIQISGQTAQVNISIPTTVLNGVFGTNPLMLTSASGGVTISSGSIVSAGLKAPVDNFSDIYVGGVNTPPCSGFGYIMHPGDPLGIDINNFNKLMAVAVVSGDTISFIGVI